MNTPISTIFVLIILLTVTNCIQAQISSEYYVDTEVSVISDYEFGLINDIEISSDKKIYVNDLFLGVLVFDEYGEILLEYNSKGKGPGDFVSIEDLLLVDEKLYTVDSELFRVTIYDRNSLEYIDSYNLPPITNKDGDVFSPGKLWEFRNGNFIVEYKRSYNRNNIDQDHLRQYTLTDSMFNTLDENLFESRDREMLTYSAGNDFLVSMHPFGREELIDVTPNGVVYKLWSQQKCIEFFRPDKDREPKQKCIDRLSEESISESDRIKMTESEDADLYRKISMPNSYPYAEELLVDSSTKKASLWITKRNTSGFTEIIEIEPETGSLEKIIKAGISFKLMEAKDGVLYGINRIDPISGYQALKIYRININ